MTRWTDAPVCGGSYADESLPWSHQQTINYLLVKAERPGGRSALKLRDVPGFSTFTDLGTGAPIRGARNVEGLLLVVSLTNLFSISPTGVPTKVGNIPGVGRVSMAHNQIAGGNQVAIANGQSGYVYNTVDGTLVQITDEGFPGAISFDYVDGYITGIAPNRQVAFISELADATSYNTLDEFQSEGSPDKLIGQLVTHRELWLFNERTTEPFVDTGNNTGTFQRQSGVIMERGAASAFCMVVLDNSAFWVGDDGVVYRANGYTPQRISDMAVESDLAKCNLALCFAFTYEDQGHKVYYLTCPDGKTWGFDVASGEWHRRKSEGLERWRINTLTNWNGKWIAGDYSNGKLYVLDWNLMDEDGSVLERRRTTGVLSDSQNATIVNGFELVIDTGVSPGVQHVPQLYLAGDLPNGITDEDIDFHYRAFNATGAVTFSILSGALPTGTSMDASGHVTGDYETAGTYSWIVKGVDSAGNIATLPDSAIVTVPTFESVVKSFAPILYLPMSEISGTIAADDSGFGHPGVITGATLGQAGLRPGSTSYEFTKIGDVVVVADFAELDTVFNANPIFSAMVIAKRTGTLTSNFFGRMFGKFVNPNTGNTTFALDVGGTGHAGGYYDSGMGGSPQLAQDTDIIDGDPHIWLVTCDGTTITLYKDGISVSAIATGGVVGQNSHSWSVTVGGSPDFPGSYQYEGFLSDAALFDSCLTSSNALHLAELAGYA